MRTQQHQQHRTPPQKERGAARQRRTQPTRSDTTAPAESVAVIDVPVDHEARVYLVERHITSQAELHGLATEYAQRSETCGIPAILATLRTADELADAIA